MTPEQNATTTRYYDQQAKDGFFDGLRSWLADEGYAVVPAEDIEEIRSHLLWGLEDSPERMTEALRRIARVASSEAWS